MSKRRNFRKGKATNRSLHEWGKDFEHDLTRTDDCIRKLTQKIKEIDLRKEEAKVIMAHKKNLQFKQELLEQKAAFEKKTKDEQGQARQNNIPTSSSTAKLQLNDIDSAM